MQALPCASKRQLVSGRRRGLRGTTVGAAVGERGVVRWWLLSTLYAEVALLSLDSFECAVIVGEFFLARAGGHSESLRCLLPLADAVGSKNAVYRFCLSRLSC